MATVPVKPEYGPTLGRLAAPRWRALGAGLRIAIAGAAVALVIGAGALALSLLNATYAHGGRVPFSFSYRGLYRVAPDPGGYVKVINRGPLRYSYAVEPLRLAPYTGEQAGALAIFAAHHIGVLEGRYSDFQLRGEGKTKVGKMIGYQVLYTTTVAGREMYGRNILLLPERAGATEGVEIAMLTAPGAVAKVKGPGEVASTGILQRPLKTFSFG